MPPCMHGPVPLALGPLTLNTTSSSLSRGGDSYHKVGGGGGGGRNFAMSPSLLSSSANIYNISCKRVGRTRRGRPETEALLPYVSNTPLSCNFGEGRELAISFTSLPCSGGVV